jgi:DNA-binding response OmpR family regulator
MVRMRYEACFPMLIDGDRKFLPMLRTAFLNAGVPENQIRSFHDGSAAVDALTAASTLPAPSTKSAPSFVLIDLELPGRSGLEVLQWLRTSSPLKDLPVFVLTSKGTADLITRALDLKVRSYFLKPDGFRELEAIVEGMLAHWFRRSQGPMDEAEPR